MHKYSKAGGRGEAYTCLQCVYEYSYSYAKHTYTNALYISNGGASNSSNISRMTYISLYKQVSKPCNTLQPTHHFSCNPARHSSARGASCTN